MNTLSPKEGRHLTRDLCDAVLEDKTLLEYIMDEYVYLLDDKRQAEVRKLADQELEHDYA